MSEKRNSVKVYLTAKEQDVLDQQAKALGLSRGKLIRDRALGAPTSPSDAAMPAMTLRQYQNGVRAALAASQGCAPRPIIEAIAAAVICAAHKPVTSVTTDDAD